MREYDRKTKQITETKEFRQDTLNFLYNNFFGRIILKLIIARPWFSKVRSIYQKSKFSSKDIIHFIDEYNIDMSKYKKTDYYSFNDFFTRKRDIVDKSSINELVAIADGKLSCYKIDEELMIKIKNSVYRINEIVGTDDRLEDYLGGTCLIYRLSVDDYHRYSFLDKGEILKNYYIKGYLHTIRPISSEYKAFSRNCREVSILKTDNFGKVIQVEVGAMLVGHIVNHKRIGEFSKLEEKGFFEYGGSTIVQLFTDCIKIDKDIIENSQKGIEIKIEIGERIGKNDQCD